MLFYVLDNKSDSYKCLKGCYDAYVDVYGNTNALRWAEEQVRINDGKYIVPVSEHYKNPENYKIEESAPDWYEEI